jgi:peptidoglycan/LPS O-acetylase OafA/YrhL
VGVGDELGRRGKVGFVSACALCCVVPMLLIAGLVSLGALVTLGVAAASIAAVAMVAVGVGSGRLTDVSPRLRRVLFAAGGAAAFGGLLNANHGARAAAFIAVGVGLLACCALLSLPASQSTNCAPTD